MGVVAGLAGFTLPAARAQTASITTLQSFVGPPNGVNPEAGLIQGSDGNFYGTTSSGGPYNLGTVFSIAPAGTLTTLYSFSGSDGANPQAGLIHHARGRPHNAPQL